MRLGQCPATRGWPSANECGRSSEQPEKELNLTDDQTQKVTALYTEFEKKMKEAGQGSREQMRTQREKLNQQVEALLTDEQKKVFQEKQAQRRGSGKGQGRKQ